MENNENKNTENTSAESSCPVEDTLDEDTADIKAKEESKDDAAPERISLVHSVFEWIELFVLAFTVVLLLMTFIGRHSPVVGESMLPTLEEGDVLIVSDIAYTPKNGDIIVCQSPWNQCETDLIGFNEPLVKRIIAVGGQEVNIDFYTWSVYIDGEKLEEDYIKKYDDMPMRAYNDGITFPLIVPEGYVFVLGDNRNGSIDSRSAMIGLIDERFIVGRVVFRVLPFDKIGTVK